MQFILFLIFMTGKKIIENDAVPDVLDAPNDNSGMKTVMGKIAAAPRIGDIMEGPVAAFDRSAVYIDLAPYGTGIIYGREYINARDVIRHVSLGDTIAAKVVDTESDSGYIELSLREARQAIIWAEAEDAVKNKTVLELPVKEANKGGLIIEWQGIPGFLPASQLNAEHYPRVEDGSKERILEELKKLVGQKLAVAIISALPKEGKLIFSEKDSNLKEREEIISKYGVGDIVGGEVTGIVDFGMFVKIEDGLEGLVHISEMDWGLVENPKTLFKVGELVKAKIIEVKDGKISLSIKALKENPWASAKDKYKKGDIVSGVVIKFNKHGALVSVEEGVAGLVHISEFGTEEQMKEKISLGSTHPFQITLFDSENQKMILAYLGDKEKE
ncbi:MAG: 30S ribosomal protein S1 [Candidatus Lloydbacteria bacterium CG22_combo_CG10-13_8_21_14_all_47_15]|uniref:30S ribosomal protein S1 n=1 Tax=Candidatus Lloydbacteria bacterium CG22_combo_CG10-13_8_21_14_all_47_15 TaxID=1974635 RepID=A0A2H0CUP4_9BACT|nr:MAG: 30S ribosomal protein S1 [Candidatus Lloydbacteria bacterium CG22_combo_CG10-13_8_21_14_all_47_15]